MPQIDITRWDSLRKYVRTLLFRNDCRQLRGHIFHLRSAYVAHSLHTETYNRHYENFVPSNSCAEFQVDKGNMSIRSINVSKHRLETQEKLSYTRYMPRKQKNNGDNLQDGFESVLSRLFDAPRSFSWDERSWKRYQDTEMH